MHLYQWYAPPCIPGADVGERREIYCQNLSQGLVLSQDCPNLLKWRTPLHIFKRVGDHHHVPYSHNCDCDQSGVNGQDELLAAGLGSIYLTVNS